MKKTVLTLLLSLSLALGLCAFTACSQNDDDDNDTGSTYASVVNKFESFSSEDEVYGFTAASAATVLSAMGESAETYAASLSSRGALEAAPCSSVEHIADDEDDEYYIVEDDDDDGDIEDTVDALNDYMLLAESLLSEDAYTFEQTEITAEDEGYTDYAYKTVISYSGLSGDTFSYTMYYNETVTEEKTETYAASLSSRGALDAAPCSSGGHTADDVDHIVDDDDDEDYIVDDDDEDDPIEQTTDYVKIERETVLTGVIVIEGTDYPVSGESKYESETGDESEIEYEQELLVTTGADSYMKIKLETETEDEDGETESETKYSYAFYESGSLTATNTFKYETEDDETRLKLTSYDAETEETTVFYYEIEEEDGVQSIKIRIGTSDAAESLTVTIAEDGSYVYTANSGTKYYKDR